MKKKVFLGKRLNKGMESGGGCIKRGRHKGGGRERGDKGKNLRIFGKGGLKDMMYSITAPREAKFSRKQNKFCLIPTLLRRWNNRT